MAPRTYGGGSGPYDSLWSTAVNWTGDTVPVAGDDVILDGTRVSDLTCDVTTPNLLSFTQSTAYTGKLSIGNSKGIDAQTYTIYGKLELADYSSLTVSGTTNPKIYLKSESVLTGLGTNSTINLFSNAQVMELAGSISGVYLYFYINSSTYPVKALDYSQFAEVKFLHNHASQTRTIVLEGGTHTLPATKIQVDYTGVIFTVDAGTNNPTILFKGAFSTSIASGSTANCTLGSGAKTFENAVSFLGLTVTGTGSITLGGTTGTFNIDFGTFTVPTLVVNCGLGTRIITASATITTMTHTAGAITISASKTLTATNLSQAASITIVGTLAIVTGWTRTAGNVTGSGTLKISANATFPDFTGATLQALLMRIFRKNDNLPAQDYSGITEVRIEADAGGPLTMTPVAGTFTFNQLTFKPSGNNALTYDATVNNTILTVGSTFAISLQTGSGNTLTIKQGTNDWTLKDGATYGNLGTTPLPTWTTAGGSVVLGGTSGTHSLYFGDIIIPKITVNAGISTKTFPGGLYCSEFYGNVGKIAFEEGSEIFADIMELDTNVEFQTDNVVVTINTGASNYLELKESANITGIGRFFIGPSAYVKAINSMATVESTITLDFDCDNANTLPIDYTTFDTVRIIGTSASATSFDFADGEYTFNDLTFLSTGAGNATLNNAANDSTIYIEGDFSTPSFAGNGIIAWGDGDFYCAGNISTAGLTSTTGGGSSRFILNGLGSQSVYQPSINSFLGDCLCAENPSRQITLYGSYLATISFVGIELILISGQTIYIANVAGLSEVSLHSSVSGSDANLDCIGTASIYNAIIKDINCSINPITVYNSIDSGGNTDITFGYTEPAGDICTTGAGF